MTPPFTECGLFVDLDGGKNLLPEASLVLIHDDEGQQAGIDHLHQILIFQGFRGRLYVDEGLTRGFAGLVIGDEALEVT